MFRRWWYASKPLVNFEWTLLTMCSSNILHIIKTTWLILCRTPQCWQNSSDQLKNGHKTCGGVLECCGLWGGLSGSDLHPTDAWSEMDLGNLMPWACFYISVRGCIILLLVSLPSALPHVSVYDCCMSEVVAGGAVGAEWQPRFCQSAPGQLWLLL